jgi:phosphoserine aminotransferase
MKDGGKAAYLDTGTWASGAIKEAQFFWETVVVASSKDQKITIFLKDTQCLLMLITFTALVTTLFWYTNKRLPCSKHACGV